MWIRLYLHTYIRTYIRTYVSDFDFAYTPAIARDRQATFAPLPALTSIILRRPLPTYLTTTNY
jgi:hypothetical protein